MDQNPEGSISKKRRKKNFFSIVHVLRIFLTNSKNPGGILNRDRSLIMAGGGGGRVQKGEALKSFFLWAIQ